MSDTAPRPAVAVTAAAAAVVSVAYRVHRLEAMEAFYGEAFGVRFRTVRTGAIDSRFGELGGLTLKLVPIRGGVDFDGFAVHQLGVEVDALEPVMAAAERHGGRVVGQPVGVDGVRQVAVRDPDGNTVEVVEREEGAAGT